MSGPQGVTTLASIDNAITINLGLSSRYANQWTPKAAFRELVQNWRDGIIKEFNILESDFLVTCREYDDQIIYKATIRGNQVCLGYIRWSRFFGEGTVDILNRRAVLQPWHLDMGGTSKQHENNQAGAHGEGLKVAALVLMRQPQDHAVRIVSGGFWWSFYFDGQNKLVAHIAKAVPPRERFGDIYSVYSDADKQTRAHHFLSPHAIGPAQNAVQVFIDAKGRDESRRKAQKEVTREEFKEWCKAALFLQQIDAENVVTTPTGDLILDPRFGGHVYLKGLLLKESTNGRSASITGKVLRYGYNFATGATNRERESMAAADEESRAILYIWDRAVAMKRDLVGRIHDLLNSRKPEYADVAKADEFIIGWALPMFLKTYLLTQFTEKWFYAAREKTENSRFDNVVQGLGCEPFVLKESYWKIMQTTGFQTAAEKEQQEFLAAPDISIPNETFAQNFYHLIRAGLASCPQTSGTNLRFVGAGSLGLDSFFSEPQQMLKIHEKWLTETGAVEELGLPKKILMDSLLFNAARRLLADRIQQVPLDRFPRGNRTTYWSRKQAISEVDQRILEYMQIKKDLRFTSKGNKLTVEWNTTTGWVPGSHIDVHVHQLDTCSHLKSKVIAREFPSRCLPFSLNHGCRIIKAVWRSGRIEVCVREGVKYFAAIRNTSSGSSFVVFSDEPQVVKEAKKRASTSTPRDESKIFTLGNRTERPDLMIPRNWYEGSNSIGTQAVIGIATADDPASASKRQRTAGTCVFITVLRLRGGRGFLKMIFEEISVLLLDESQASTAIVFRSDLT
ncbi:hypothetical protein F4818DRAFT_439180 [Hypoxylon cercidicola]|nr:hypothetical protein F4818DRAFT_439180 [Hypoxylon cercidicola]